MTRVCSVGWLWLVWPAGLVGLALCAGSNSVQSTHFAIHTRLLGQTWARAYVAKCLITRGVCVARAPAKEGIMRARVRMFCDAGKSKLLHKDCVRTIGACGVLPERLFECSNTHRHTHKMRCKFDKSAIARAFDFETRSYWRAVCTMHCETMTGRHDDVRRDSTETERHNTTWTRKRNIHKKAIGLSC